MRKGIKILSVTAALTALLLFFANAFYVWNWGDDYLFKNKFTYISPLRFLIHDYFIFDGRSLNAGYLISRHCLLTDLPWLATLIASVFFFFASALLAGMAFRNSLVNRLTGIVFFLSLLWLSSFYSLSETLYWQTGMLYIVEVFLLLYTYYLASGSEKNIPWQAMFILGLVSGVASPGAVLAVMFVMITERICDKELNPVNKRKRVAASAGLFSGLLIVLLSPGSSIRFELEGGMDMKAFSNIHEMYFRIHQFFTAFFERNTAAVWFSLFCGTMMALGKLSKKRDDVNRHGLIHAVYEFRWLIAAVFSLMFYFPRLIYYINSPRLNIHFAFFSVVFMASQLSSLRGDEAGNAISRLRPLFPLTIVCFIAFAFSQFWGARFALGKMKQREALYRANRGKGLVLKANDLIGPPSTRLFIDVEQDPAYAINVGIAQFYGLRYIRKEKYR